jgi:formylglycine-generating enzyme required for sulfatase activity
LEGNKEPKPEPKTDEPAPKPKPAPAPPIPKIKSNDLDLSLWRNLALIGLFVLGLGLFFYFNNNQEVTPPRIQVTPSRITPQTDPFLGQMVLVSGGSFNMGSNEGEDDEKPVHRVRVSSFYMGKYEVTQAQCLAVMDSNYSWIKGCDNCPVENVNWNETQVFLKKLNAQTGKNYRLPTEAEWEYAAGGGATNRTRFGNGQNILDPNKANCTSNYRGEPTPVGSFSPNALGLYDMSGNVYEWCADLYKGYPGSSGVSDFTNKDRVKRGGSWGCKPHDIRVATRSNLQPWYTDAHSGFRLALSQ